MAPRQRKAAQEAVVATTQSEAPTRKRGPRAGSENARRGGMAVREKYGHEFFARIGAKGGKTVRERCGPEFYATIGRMGGLTTRKNLGVKHYEQIGRMGGLRARKRNTQDQATTDR